MDLPKRASQRSDFIWLAVILVLAVLLRLVGLDAPLWFDEIATVDSHINLSWGDMMRDYSMNHHYFFSVQAKLASTVFGDEIWAYRLPAMLFGSATVAAIWWLARDIAGSRIAHVSALLTAISYHQVWFSQNARGYTELAFWSTLGLIFFLRGMKAPTYRVWIGFGLSLAAAVFTHLTGAFFFVALGLVWIALVLFGGRQRISRAHITLPLLGSLLGLALLVAFYMPILPSLLETVGGVAETSAVDPMKEYQNPVWAVLEGVRTALGNAGPLVPLAAVTGLVIVGLGMVGAHRTAPLFAPVVVMHIVLTIAVLLAVGMRIWPRFFFVDIGLFLILIVIGLSVIARLMAKIIRRPAAENALFVLAIAAVVLVSAGLLKRNYDAPKQDMAAAFELAEDMRGPGERVYSIGPSGPIYQGFFQADWGNIRTPEDYAQVVSEPGPFTVVVTFPARSFRSIPEMKQDIGTALELVHRFPGTLGDGDILVLRRK